MQARATQGWPLLEQRKPRSRKAAEKALRGKPKAGFPLVPGWTDRLAVQTDWRGAVDANSRLRFARETQLLATAPEKIAMRCAHLPLSGRTEAACNGEILAITAAKSIFLL
jgi:hypothetical protein